ncbi:SDR family oxidoreductase [Baekduia sp. Peel2402]|uniref:SDR family oxidoreductase n=1 Tax=Baekduia sp. Peel2402 TaxID=3458296 RepID=UPI00403EACFD
MTQLTVEGSVALVTGANRGLGKAFARALLDAGAAKVYAAARDVSTIDDPDVVPVALDVTDHAQVAKLAEELGDVQIVINNAGVSSGQTATSGEGLDAYRAEFEVNYFGLVAVSRAFAPVVARNGGGAIVNMLSALSWATFEQTANYSATKAAGWAYTNGLRQSLADQGTLVVAVHAGYIDTDMVASIDAPKIRPEDVARQVVEGLDAGAEEVLADDVSRFAKASLAGAAA